jgi:hypothetical protein
LRLIGLYFRAVVSAQMHFRLAPRKHGDVTYTYLQLVAAFDEDGKNRQRVLHSSGNVEALRHDGQLGRLVDRLQRAAGAGGAETRSA